ncbi:MAG: hypothetical protein EOM55_02775 [Clostridia bacterium]|nr:hypothetical protein [Clostridia bacterium]
MKNNKKIAKNENEIKDINQAIADVMVNLHPGKKICRSKIITNTINGGIIYSCECRKSIEGKTICKLNVTDIAEGKSYPILLAFDRQNEFLFIDDKIEGHLSEEEMERHVAKRLHPEMIKKSTQENHEYLGL